MRLITISAYSCVIQIQSTRVALMSSRVNADNDSRSPAWIILIGIIFFRCDRFH